MLNSSWRGTGGGCSALSEMNIGVRTSVVDYSRSEALNVRSGQGSLQDILETNEAGIYLISDVDPELLFQISFKDPTTITGCHFYCPPPHPTTDDAAGSPSTSGPKKIHFFSNHDNLDFQDAKEIPPDQVVELKEQEVADPDHRTALRGAKFQKCNSIQIYIDSNQGNTPATCLSSMRLYGFVCPPYTQQHMRTG